VGFLVEVRIRNIPDEVHRKLKARAALAGLTLEKYILKVLEEAVRE